MNKNAQATRHGVSNYSSKVCLSQRIRSISLARTPSKTRGACNSQLTQTLTTV